MKIKITILFLSFINLCNSQIVNIPDTFFKAKLLLANTSNSIAKDLSGNNIKIDTNNDNQIQVSEALMVYELYVSQTNISDLTGILNFSNVRKLDCSLNSLVNLNINTLTQLTYLNCHNNQITNLIVNIFPNLQSLDCNRNLISSLNLSGLNYLFYLWCGNNLLPSLNVTGLTNLQFLYCDVNQIPSLDLTGLINLKDLRCQNNLLPSLNLTGLNNLNTLNFSFNQISNINVNNLTALKYIQCYNNQLTSLNVSGLINLLEINFNNNQLVTFDASTLSSLQNLYCNNNQLTNLFIKNNKIENTLSFSNNPNLQFVCADSNQTTQVQNLINSYGYINCILSSNCTLGIDNNNFANDNFELYPNPAESELFFKTNQIIKQIDIFDINGKNIKTLFITNENKIYINELNNGTYLLKTTTAEKGIINTKIIKK